MAGAAVWGGGRDFYATWRLVTRPCAVTPFNPTGREYCTLGAGAWGCGECRIVSLVQPAPTSLCRVR